MLQPRCTQAAILRSLQLKAVTSMTLPWQARQQRPHGCFQPRSNFDRDYRQPLCMEKIPALLLALMLFIHPLANMQSMCVVTATHDRSLARSLKLSALIVWALESSSSVLAREPKNVATTQTWLEIPAARQRSKKLAPYYQVTQTYPRKMVFGPLWHIPQHNFSERT